MKATRRKFLYFILIAIIMSVLVPVTQARSIFNNFDLALEREIGYFHAQQVLAQSQVVEIRGPERERLERVFTALTQKTQRKEITFSLRVVRDPSINAFALPEGYVFVNTGLLDFVQTDGELAGVLAHEIAHVERRHGMKAIYRAAGVSMALHVFLKNEKDDQAKEMQQLVNISANLVQLGYSRDAELEADRYGVWLMRRAGYDKRDLLNFWQRVLANSGDGSNSILKIFATHPPTRERIKAIEGMN